MQKNIENVAVTPELMNQGYKQTHQTHKTTQKTVLKEKLSHCKLNMKHPCWCNNHNIYKSSQSQPTHN